jgi:hypothetical protein
MADKKQHEYYVGVESPTEIRKGLLESSRDIIHMLQSHERIKSLRNEKNDQLQKLDSLMRDIYMLSNKLKAQLPKLPAKKKVPEKGQKKGEDKKKVEVKRKEEPKKIQAPVKQTIIPKERTALELLEEELVNVEKQLSGIK